PTNINETSSVALNVSFNDPGIADAHSILVNWGDGITTSNYLAAGLGNLSVNHTYQDDLPNGTATDLVPINITVIDDRASATAATTVRVNNLPPTLSNFAVTTPVNAGTNATLSGNIADASPLDVLTLTVNWGDGSAIQSNPFALGTSRFNLTHRYTVPRDTNFSINVMLSDDDAGSVSNNLTIRVLFQASSAKFKSLKYLTNSVVLQLEGSPNTTYRIQACNDRWQWLNLGSQTANAQGTFQFLDTAPLTTGRFYRAIWP